MLRGGVVHAHLGGLERGVECMIGVQSREVDCWGQHSLGVCVCPVRSLQLCDVSFVHWRAALRASRGSRGRVAAPGARQPRLPRQPHRQGRPPARPTRLPPGIDEVDEWLPDALWQVGGERGVSFWGPSASQRRWGGGRAHRELHLQQGTVIELESELVERPRHVVGFGNARCCAVVNSPKTPQALAAAAVLS